MNNTDKTAPKLEAKIIPFPQNRIVRMIPPDVGDALDQKRKYRIANKILTELMTDFMDEIKEGYELDISSIESKKDFSYLMEILRSSVYRLFDIPHPLQTYVDENVTMVDQIQTDSVLNEAENVNDETSNNTPMIETTD
jgi:hypothetical protein